MIPRVVKYNIIYRVVKYALYSYNGYILYFRRKIDVTVEQSVNYVTITGYYMGKSNVTALNCLVKLMNLWIFIPEFTVQLHTLKIICT